MRKILLATTAILALAMGAKADEIIKFCDKTTDASIYSITVRTVVNGVTVNQGYTLVNAAGAPAPLPPNSCNFIDVATPLVGGLTLFGDVKSPEIVGGRGSVQFPLVQVTVQLQSFKVVPSPYVSGGPYPLSVNKGSNIPTSLGGKIVVWATPAATD